MYIKKGMSVTTSSINSKTIYTVEITDEEELQKFDKTGEGKLISRTITYILPTENDIGIDDSLISTYGLFADYIIGSWSYVGNRYYTESEGTPFRIEGKANFIYIASTSTTYKLYGEGSGKVKGLVEVKIGGEIGGTSTTYHK